MTKGRWIRGGDGSHWEGCAQAHWDCMEKELNELKEFYRWRKYPEEKPEKDGEYSVLWIDGDDIPICGVLNYIGGDWMGCFDADDIPKMWTNLPALPEEDK